MTPTRTEKPDALLVQDTVDLADRIVDCLHRGDRATLTALYHPRALLDPNVPQWRFQLTGRAAIGEALATVPGRRISWLRRTDTADGLLVENEIRYTDGGGEGLWRNAHVFRFHGGGVDAMTSSR